MTQIKKGRYKHFKGAEYEVIDVAKHSETLEEYVVYRSLYGEHDLWIRPISMFLDTKEVKGKFVPRFVLIEENSTD
jgi:cyclomaltodextrinase